MAAEPNSQIGRFLRQIAELRSTAKDLDSMGYALFAIKLHRLADEIEEASIHVWNEALEVISARVAGPYPEDIFSALSDSELMRCVDVLTHSGVPAASDRLHASWARHWSKALNEQKSSR